MPTHTRRRLRVSSELGTMALRLLPYGTFQRRGGEQLGAPGPTTHFRRIRQQNAGDEKANEWLEGGHETRTTRTHQEDKMKPRMERAFQDDKGTFLGRLPFSLYPLFLGGEKVCTRSKVSGGKKKKKEVLCERGSRKYPKKKRGAKEGGEGFGRFWKPLETLNSSG